MPNRSLNQIVNDLIRYGEAHPMLETVLFEPPVDIFDSGDIKYRAFLFNYNGAHKDGSLLTMRFTGWVYDLMFKEADNEKDVWSDTTAIACDIVQYLDDFNERPYYLIDSIDIQALSHETGDLLSGVRFDWAIQMPMPSFCLVPDPVDGGPFLITDDGRFILTEDGRKIIVEQSTGILLLADSGQPLLTDNGLNLILG